MVSSRHFLIYKETDTDPVKNKPIQRVFLKDLRYQPTITFPYFSLLNRHGVEPGASL
jgi:hypothetical protein